MPNARIFTGAVEGAVDEVVLRRIVRDVGHDVQTAYVAEGKQKLLRRLNGFNQAAQYAPWIVLIDLNAQECAPGLVADALPNPTPQMYLRVAVRAVEAWLLADGDRIASFLSVSTARVPAEPDWEQNPKQSLVNIARHSRRRRIRYDMVPSHRSGRQVGPAYQARLIEFVVDPMNGWRPTAAADRSDSLRRCLRALA